MGVARCTVCKAEAFPGRNGGPWVIDHDERCRHHVRHDTEQVGGVDLPAILRLCHACEEVMIPTHFSDATIAEIIKALKPDTDYDFVGVFTHDTWRPSEADS